MQVITLNNSDFADTCSLLESRVREAGYRPDLVVGIATGGVYVADLIFPDVVHASVVCRRPSSAGKEKSARTMRLIRHLPLVIRNWLRKCESALLISRNNPERRPHIDDETHRLLREAGSILVVDDAVDSGATLRTVLSSINNVVATNPLRSVMSAAITVTTSSPVVVPDFYIYKNRTLIRFPWSKDNPN